jgi:hypothetical protein
MIHDSTPEKAAEILSRAPSGCLMVQDELAGWMGSFERYSAGASSRAFYLQCWNGGTFLKDRVGKGKHDPDAEIRVDNLAMGILGGIQPDRLASLKDLTSDGLLQRFLPVLMRPAERGDENYPVTKAEDDYEKLIKALCDAPSQKYYFEDNAREALTKVFDYLHRLEQVDGFSPALIGAIGKLKGYLVRICLVLHITEQYDAPIADEKLPECFTREARDSVRDICADVETGSEGLNVSRPISSRTAISCPTVEAAEKILREFLLPHVFGLYDVLVNGGEDRERVRAIGDFILASDKDRLLPSDFTSGVRVLRTQPAHRVAEWAGRFCAMGWIEPEEGKTPIPKAWKVVSGLREHFAERRKKAQAARAEAHRILEAGGSRRRAGGV